MKRLVPLSLAALVLTASGCHLFPWKKKPAEPKPSLKLATEVEKDFMNRWIGKRTAELVAQGHSQQDAHEIAVSEYKKTFIYTRTVNQVN